MDHDDPHNYLIERIYDAALLEDGWDGLLTELSAHFRSEAGGFFVQTAEQRLGYFRFIGMDDAELEFYDNHISALNPWYQVPNLMRPGAVLTDTSLEVLHKSNKAFEHSEFYHEWIRKLDFRHVLGGTLLDSDGNHLNFTFFRPRQLGIYSAEEIDSFRLLSRHVARAVELKARVETERWMRRSGESMLDDLSIGMLMIDHTDRVLLANPAAEQLLRAETALKMRRNRLIAHDDNDQRALQARLKKLSEQGGNDFLSVKNGDAAPLSLFMTANPPPTLMFPPTPRSITLFILDPSTQRISADHQLRKQWNLTNKEAEFANLLLQGNSVGESADRLKMTIETGRWYCKRIMEKVGVRRQPDLMIRLIRSTLIVRRE